MSKVLFPAAILVSAFIVSASSAQERSIAKKDVPKVILDAFRTSYPGATVKGYSKEMEKNVLTYEIESMEGTVHRDVTYRADGTLVSVEQTLPYTDLPESVRATISREFPKAKVSICEKIMKGSTTQFEVLLTTGRKKVELVLNSDGTVVEQENK